VTFLRDMLDEDYARVDSKVTDSKVTPYAVTYKRLSRDGDWGIYDLIVENVRLVNNYRSQSGRIIKILVPRFSPKDEG
jgi:phospholipid transport system substrate-binding protein